MAMPRVVFMIEKPSAPALRQASAISAMLVTSGESLAKIGTLLLVLRRTWWITPEALITSQANTCPRLSTFGQEMFTSSAAMPGSLRKTRANWP